MLEVRSLIKKVHQPGGEPLTIAQVEHLFVAAGEQLIIAGPSGSGKTTLLHMIAGLTAPTAGELFWDKKRLDLLSAGERDTWRAHNLGYIFQNFNLLNSLSAVENIMVAAAFGGEKRQDRRHQKSMNLLLQVGLADKAAYKPNRLSTGEQQRVAVARALVNKPALILADEPTASLDRDNVKLVLKLLQALCAANHSTLLLATHDQEVIAGFPRIFAMRRPGRNEV
ncbi:ABC transporter ATP-binding protein YtrE [Sporomusa termitida]|uniref:ABC transporter ATP-binding protein YtrE n=2 Tax=Sporomusa termitida TaxID=2377 RepID=A0A517DUD5_9FIRM|nr:ABC transporter ATP-binding protein YtrE [Sporomusa termitida]